MIDEMVQELKELEGKLLGASPEEVRELCLKAQSVLTRYSLNTWRHWYNQSLPSKEVKVEEKLETEDYQPPF